MRNSITIRAIEAQKIDNLKKSRAQIAEFNLYRYPTPTKKIKSLGMLKKKIEEFFSQYEVTDKTKPKSLPLPSDLALFLGFSSYRAMASAINSPTDPAWSAELEKAVEHINSMLMRAELDIATKAKDVRGVDNVLKRIDKTNDSTIIKDDSKNQINIQINLDHRNKIQGFVDDRLSTLIGSMEPIEEKPIEEAEFEEVEP